MTGLAPSGAGYDAQRAAVVQLMSDGHWHLTAQLARQVGCSEGRIRDIVKALVSEGHAERERAKGSTYLVYRRVGIG